MSSATMDRARHMATELLRMESRGSGDLENAMRRLGTRHGINWRLFWTLRYRAPRDMMVSAFEKLDAAYRAECTRQLKRLEHELHVARTAGATVDDIAAAAAALVADEKGGEA